MFAATLARVIELIPLPLLPAFGGIFDLKREGGSPSLFKRGIQVKNPATGGGEFLFVVLLPRSA